MRSPRSAEKERLLSPGRSAAPRSFSTEGAAQRKPEGAKEITKQKNGNKNKEIKPLAWTPRETAGVRAASMRAQYVPCGEGFRVKGLGFEI